jgi:hypothetical protein
MWGFSTLSSAVLPVVIGFTYTVVIGRWLCVERELRRLKEEHSNAFVQVSTGDWPYDRSLYKKYSCRLSFFPFHPPSSNAGQWLPNTMVVADDGSTWMADGNKWRHVTVGK